MKSFTGLMGFGGVSGMLSASAAMQKKDGAAKKGGSGSPEDEVAKKLGSEPVNVELTKEYLDELKKHSFDYRVLPKSAI